MVARPRDSSWGVKRSRISVQLQGASFTLRSMQMVPFRVETGMVFPEGVHSGSPGEKWSESKGAKRGGVKRVCQWARRGKEKSATFRTYSLLL